MDIKAIENRISNYLILFEGKHLTRRQTMDKIIHIPISEGEVCPSCEDGYLPNDDTGEPNPPVGGIRCPICMGEGKLPGRDIEYAIKKCQEG